MRVSPGLSSFAADPARAGESLWPLIEFAREKIGSAVGAAAEARLMATAGLRLLEEHAQEAILASCREVLKASGFRFEDAWAKDESLDFDVFLDSSSEHCANTSATDVTGLVTLLCPATVPNETTGSSVVLTQASLTMDDEVYNIPLAENDAAVPQFCEEQQPEGAHFGASLCAAVRALSDYPLYSRHSSFKEPGCHDTPELGAEPAV